MPIDSAVIDRLRPLGAIFGPATPLATGSHGATSIKHATRVSSSRCPAGSSSCERRLGSIRSTSWWSALARPGHGLLGSALAHWDLSDETPTRVDLAVPAGSHRPRITIHPPTSTSLERATSDLAASRWRWARTSVFASLTPKGLSSTVFDSDIALGSTSPSPVCAGTFAVHGPNQAASSNWPRSCEFARRSSKRCGCCRNEHGPTRLDCGAA